jgi:acetyl esterase
MPGRKNKGNGRRDGRRTQEETMLDLQAKALLKQAEDQGAPDFADLPPPESRVFFSEFVKTVTNPTADVEISNRTVPGPAGEVPIRVYRPKLKSGELPCLAYFHGGGFVIGSLDDYDGVCSRIAQDSECVVVSVDYRLSPEHPFPAAPEDCYAVVEWLAGNGSEVGVDGSQLAVGGDSAGGNLAAVCALQARDSKGPAIRYQLLLYPVTSSRGESTESFRQFADGYFLTADTMAYFMKHYTGGQGDPDDQRLAPLMARLNDLPPALVLVAGFDPLRDQGIAYAEKMIKDGSQAVLVNYRGTIHGFISLAGALEAGQQALDHISGALKRAMHG